MNRGVLTLVLLLSLVTSGCGTDEPVAPSVLTGVITRVAGTGGEVTGFDLEADGNSYRILIDDRRDYGFDLTHLREHESTGDPVRVRLQERDEALYAVRIDDA
jgi:hypothetical protein